MFRNENRSYILFSAAAVLLSLIGIVWFFVLFFGDAGLEKAAQAEIAELTGTEQFTIEFIEEMEYGKKHKQNHVTIGYTVEGDATDYMGWYYWEEGELVHDFTRELGEES